MVGCSDVSAVRGLQKKRCDERARRQSLGREQLYCADLKILVVVPSLPWLDKYVRCRYVRSRLLKNTQAYSIVASREVPVHKRASSLAQLVAQERLCHFSLPPRLSATREQTKALLQSRLQRLCAAGFLSIPAASYVTRGSMF